MRAFQVLSAALVATAAHGQLLSGYRTYGSSGGYGGAYNLGTYGLGGVSYGASYAPTSVRYSTGYTPSAVSYGSTYGAPVGVAYSSRRVVSNAVPALTTTSVGAAPAIAVSTVPTAVNTISYGLGVNRGISYGFGGGLSRGISYGLGGGAGGLTTAGGVVTATGTGGGVRSHEVHTGGAGNVVRVEEYKAGGQLIRVHDSAQPAAEVVDVQGPAVAGNHVRLVSRTGGTQVERVVHQDPSVQTFDVVNPPQPADRVVNIRRAPPPAATVELVAEHHQQAVPEVVVGGDEPNVQVQHVGGGAGVAVGGASLSYAAAPAVAHVQTVHAAPTVSVAAAPVASYATRVHTVQAAPAISVAAAPVATYATRVHAAPAVSYSTVGVPAATYGTSYGTSYGTYGSGLGSTLYGTGLGSTVYGSGLGSTVYGSGLGNTLYGSYSSGLGRNVYGTSYGSYGSSLGGNSFGTTAVLSKKA
uniref:Uncharacterized protein n=1 Tax=Dermanyssus gallinae TaxID=34641 RepID=A0A146AZN0_9ACAR|nr:hypothetical protein [Dermanyssus gallinae]